MRILLSIFALVVLVGCGTLTKDNWQDKTAETISKSVAPIVATTFTCSNKEAIQANIKEKVMSLKWFKKEIETEGLGAKLCELAAGAVLPTLIDLGNDQLPEEWGCTAENAEISIVSLAKIGCEKVPF